MIRFAPTGKPSRHDPCVKTLYNRASSRARGMINAVAAEPSVWDDISKIAGKDVIETYAVRRTEVPASVPTLTIPTEEHPKSDKRVLLYRDTNGWCPFCQRVWMALLEKNIEFDTMLINLRDKPEWYGNVATNLKTPAIRLDGEYICESMDILAALEEKFPEPALMPQDKEEFDAVIEPFSGVSLTLFRLALGATPDPEPLELLRSALQYMEKVAAKHEGTFIFGEFSMAEAALSPFLPLLLEVRRGLDPADYPNLVTAMRAVTERPSYQQTAVELGTRRMVAANAFNIISDQTSIQGIPETEMRARREAAAKIAENREALINIVMHGSGKVRASGLLHSEGSSYGANGTEEETGDGTLSGPDAIAAVVEQTLQRLCTLLLSGNTGDSPEDPEETAIQAVTLAYLRNLATSPRDMSLPAAQQYRLACDAVLKCVYKFP
eukprot:jgi/Ulvmu1/5600/UM023_0137.1